MIYSHTITPDPSAGGSSLYMTTIAERMFSPSRQEVIPRNPHVTLTPVSYDTETAALWGTWISDPEAPQWMAGAVPQTEEEVRDWLYKATHEPDRHYFSVVADGTMVGIVSICQDAAPENTGEIGIVIGEKDFRSRRVGTESIIRMTDYAANTLHLDTIRAHIKPTNEKSIRLFAGQGFSLTGHVTLDGETFLRFEKNLS